MNERNGRRSDNLARNDRKMETDKTRKRKIKKKRKKKTGEGEEEEEQKKGPTQTVGIRSSNERK